MRGDFSAWNKDRSHNFRGTLHQQGRVLLDRDWNAQTEVTNEWQEISARDTFGADVAAVSADEPESFKVTGASFAGTEVTVTAAKGHVWADGLLVESDKDMTRIADYLNDPLPTSVTGRDAVILETWLEELSAFQDPDLLLEPALGGPDTTERVQTAFRFRLFRMADGDTCDTIDIEDDLSTHGKLNVELKATTTIDGDCPVVLEGGFTGFEHRLYRVEIADTDKAESYFKWSHFNGGLVGTGDFNNTDPTKPFVKIRGNKNAILYSGSKNFYLEALEFDTQRGYWKVVYGAKAVLGDNDQIKLSAAGLFKGSVPDGKTLFFRLWNGIDKVAKFTELTTERDLPDDLGIQIRFESAGKYKPSDYWTFEVRTGEIGNPPVLINNLPPQGIFYHRVPLAEIDWTQTPPEIEDCRQIFQPLTRQKTCCTYRVGDGVHSRGDFTKIQAAVDALPKSGGEICILPGEYHENVVVWKRYDRDAIIIIRGCGDRTKIIASDDKLPVITIAGVSNVSVETMYLVNPVGGGILLLGDARGGDEAATLMGDDAEVAFVEDIKKKKKEMGGEGEIGALLNINLDRLRIDTGIKSGIRMYTGYFVSITHCRIFVEDVSTQEPGVFLSGDDIEFEKNVIKVLRPRLVMGRFLGSYLNDLYGKDPASLALSLAEKAAGGLQLAGGCERVRVVDNLIESGTGNGITLGSIDVIEAGGTIRKYAVWHKKVYNPRADCDPDPGHPPEDDPGGTSVTYKFGPPLYDILIERNRIFAMGRNGIGVVAFSGIKQKDGSFDTKSGFSATNMGTSTAGLLAILGRLPAVMVTDLTIIGNRIEHCVNLKLPETSTGLSLIFARGGISLSIVDGLIVRDNDILNNGPTADVAACGIFILFGVGIDISRNRISNNGASAEAGKELAKGTRGGVIIVLALDGINKTRKSMLALRGANPSGEPALKLHENIVSVPVGRPLLFLYQGHASVTENHFQSIEAQKDTLLFPTTILIGGVDGIKNLGPLMFAANTSYSDDTNKLGATDRYRAAFEADIKSGGLIFANNQVESINDEPKNALPAYFSIMILTGGDLSFLGNQCVTRHPNQTIAANALLVGTTVRAIGNSWFEMRQTAAFSAITLGLMNTTTDNHSTHCLLVLGSLAINSQNLSVEGNCDVRSANSKILMDLFLRNQG